MIIKQVNTSELRPLYEGYRRAANEKRKAYGTELFSFLEHCMIAFELDELTTLEVYYLKKFASDVYIISDSYQNFVNSEKMPDFHQKVSGLLEIHDEIINDEDINKHKPLVDNILPIGCKSYHVYVVFKGPSIPSVTGGFVEDIFKENGALLDHYPEMVDLNRKVANMFYNNFYSFIIRKTSDLDLVTSYMTNIKFYQYADDDVNLAHVNTPLGNLTFFGASSDKLNLQIDNIKKNEKVSPYFVNDVIYLTFVLNTTFSTFMKLYLNTNFIIDNEDLKILLTSNEVNVSEEILDKYRARISNSMDYIISNRNSGDTSVVDINKFNFIFNGSKIKYSIQMTISQIEKLDKLLDGIDELEEIKTKIQTFSNTIENLIG